MSKEDVVEMEGVVAEVFPDTRFRVTLTNGIEITAYASGKIRQNHIRIIAGDRVTVEMSPYDLTKGRVTFRHKDERGAPPAGGNFRRR
ncbi:translation initiation factor IF-1 [Chitinibacter sp. S2-10]|uniref:translation initiation factor IF-1 n=1 Tax=Chitinibacter sp. S2-10 TaxID=3373597 RepID=UPI003977D931